MGYKVKTNTQTVEEDLMARLNSLGIEIELPIEDEEESNEEENEE